MVECVAGASVVVIKVGSKCLVVKVKMVYLVPLLFSVMCFRFSLVDFIIPTTVSVSVNTFLVGCLGGCSAGGMQLGRKVLVSSFT